MKILVIGKSGQLAQAIHTLDPDVTCLGRNEIDIENVESMTQVLDRYEFDGMINASAYTQVDLAESEPACAFAINHLGVENLAKYAAKRNVHFVHVSTDYVFSGDKGSPYHPDDPHAPLGVYGASKSAGESALQHYCPQSSCIIRTSWVYSAVGSNFVKTMLRLMQEKPSLNVVDDQIGSPTSALALAHACLEAVKQKVIGVYHFTDAGVCSWFDFALAIQELALSHGLLSQAVPIRPIPSSAFPTPAKRPSYSVLDKTGLASAFPDLQPQHWRVELDSVLQQLAGKNVIEAENE